jgi:hypothetical protein
MTSVRRRMRFVRQSHAADRWIAGRNFRTAAGHSDLICGHQQSHSLTRFGMYCRQLFPLPGVRLVSRPGIRVREELPVTRQLGGKTGWLKSNVEADQEHSG